MERWCGKIAVVTGASSGVGLATAKQLVYHGVIVIGLARRIEKMREEMKNVKGPGQFYAKQCDISDENHVIETFNWIQTIFSVVHILVNNAGVIKFKTIEECPTEDLETVFKVNVFGLLYCTKQALKLMREVESEGHIININSLAGHIIPDSTQVSVNVYPASKYAVTALSESLSSELSYSKIRVTSISPGAVKTAMLQSIFKVISPIHNFPALRPEDVAHTILYALSVPPHVEITEIILQMKSA